MRDDQRKKLLIGAAIFWCVLIVIVVVFAIARSLGERVDVEPIKNTPEGVQKHGITVPDLGSILTVNQADSLPALLAKRTTYKITGDKEYPAIIRSNSIVKPTVAVGSTTQFILDIPPASTSFLIDRSVGDDFDILTISCVPDSQKIYKQDNCHEE